MQQIIQSFQFFKLQQVKLNLLYSLHSCGCSKKLLDTLNTHLICNIETVLIVSF